MATVKDTIQSSIKDAMRAKDALRLSTLRLALAAIRQQEIDGQIILSDEQILEVLLKLIKQRRDAIEQYQQNNRTDLADKELAEIKVLEEFLPPALSDEEVECLIQEAIQATQAASIKDLSAVLAVLKSKAHGRIDIKKIGQIVKQKLSANSS